MAGAWGEYKNSRTKRRLQPFPLGVVEAETFRRSTTLVIGPAIKSVDGAFVGVYIPLSGHTSTNSGAASASRTVLM
jgi:hypothetical protein